MQGTASTPEVGRKPDLSVLALISFIGSFVVARAFTTLNPKTVVVTSGIHVHHFWYGLALLVVGGWLGISYNDERIDRIAAIIFGIGGGLVGDEIGILLTFESENYWAGISYTLIIILITFASILTLLNKYSKIIRKQFADFIGHNASLYFAVIVMAASIAFMVDATSRDTSDSATIVVSTTLIIVACVTISAYYVQRMRMKQQKNMK
jgi:hypothetical protein